MLGFQHDQDAKRDNDANFKSIQFGLFPRRKWPFSKDATAQLPRELISWRPYAHARHNLKLREI